MCIDCLTHDERCLALAYIDQSIAAIEKRETVPYEADMLELVYTAWIAATRRGLKAAQEFLAVVSDSLSQDELEVLIAILGQEVGIKLAEPMREGLLELFGRAYLNGKKYALADSTIAVSFNLVDETAINWLTENSLFWIGHYFTEHLSQQIADVVASGMRQGLGRKSIGNLLKDFFKEYPGVPMKPDFYWKILAASAMTRARSVSRISGFRSRGVENMKFVAILDERLCPICSLMDGRIFSVARAISVVSQLANSSSPEDIKLITPWLKEKEIVGLTEEQLMNRGFFIPPLHGLCRCSLEAA